MANGDHCLKLSLQTSKRSVGTPVGNEKSPLSPEGQFGPPVHLSSVLAKVSHIRQAFWVSEYGHISFIASSGTF